MPAIDLTRLDRQIASLATSFDEPLRFRRELHDLLSSYHLYARKSSKEKMPKSFMRHYELPDQVVRQLELGLKPFIPSRPEQTMGLVEELWQDPYFEARDLAAFLIGQVPLTHSETVRAQISSWLDQPLDQSLLESVLKKAPATLRGTDQAQWEAFLNQLLESNSAKLQYSGLLALAADLPTRSLASFIAVYKALRPFFQSSEPRVQEALLGIVSELARRNPAETIYFLKQVLAEIDSHAIEHQMRRYLGFFDNELAQSLREAVSFHAKRKLGPEDEPSLRQGKDF